MTIGYGMYTVLCGTYICDTMEYGMYTEYCVVPTYVASLDMECTLSIVWYLYMCDHGI